MRNGEEIWLTEYSPNLILDVGLDKVESNSWPQCINSCLLSTQVSPTPVNRQSGSITFTQSGTTLTASGNFFVSADAGRLFKYGTGTGGTEMYITAFTSATQVTVGVSATVSTPTVGVIWYVNDTALNSLDSASNTYRTNGGDNSTTVTGNVVTHQLTYQFASLTGSKTFTEVGFDTGTSNSNIFDRDLISPPVTLILNDVPIVRCQLAITVSPTTPGAQGNVGTGVDTTGTIQYEGLGITNSDVGLAWLNSGGGVNDSQSQNPLEPGSNSGSLGRLAVITQSFSHQTFSGGAGIGGLSNVGADGGGKNTYTPGSFVSDLVASYSGTNANTTIYGFAIYAGGQAKLTLLLTTPFTKTAPQVLTYTWHRSWQRILTN